MNLQPSLLLLAVLLSTAAGARDVAEVLFAENFSAKLDKEWAWVREDPVGWRLEKDSVVLRTPEGYLHAKLNNSKNLLLRPVPEAHLAAVAIEVLIESDPKVQYEHAGLVWYYDDDNYVCLLSESLNGKPELQMVTETAAKPQFAVKICESKRIWLRLEILGEKITTQFRETGNDTWTTVGVGQLPKVGDAKVRVGLMAGGAPKNSGRYVSFRDFKIVKLAK